MTPLIAIAYRPDRFSARDITEIRTRMSGRMNAAEVVALDVTADTVFAPEDLPSPPDLVISFDAIGSPRALRRLAAPRLIAPPLTKLDLLKRVIGAGLPTPISAVYAANTALDRRFGPFVVVKSTAPGTVRGAAIRLVRTGSFETLRADLDALYADDIAAGHRPVVQRYVHTGPNPTHMRVTSVLGEPVLAFRTTAPVPFSPEDVNEIAGDEVTSNARDDRQRSLVDEADVVSLGRAVARAFPDMPVCSADIARDAGDGSLYCIEANIGNLAALSSDVCRRLRSDLGAEAVIEQFGAYDVIADRLLVALSRARGLAGTEAARQS